MTDIFKRMTDAYLHDPPSKPLDFSHTHQKVADGFRRTTWIDQLGGHELLWSDDAESYNADDNPDHAAAAADRAVFPKPTLSGTPFAGIFRHPLCGSALSLKLITPALAEEHLQNAFGGIKATTWKEFFFLLWRQWRENTAALDRDMLFYPADTRIPDHSIWLHLDVTAALEACRNPATGKIAPAFMLFQFGPVQEFIAGARSTRDLWSGSYLIAWLTSHAIKAVTDEFGPTSVIFPSLRGQGIFDAVNRDIFEAVQYQGQTRLQSLWQRLYGSKDDDAVKRLLNPTLPNRFLALVPQHRATEIAKKAEAAVITELHAISSECWTRLNQLANEDLSQWKKRWEQQVALFPQITWQTMPFRDNIDDALTAMRQLPGSKQQADALELLKKIAVELMPETDRDSRNYSLSDKHTLSRPEFAWSANFAEIQAALAARRNTRNFQQFFTDDEQEGSPKDILSGKEEIIGDDSIWKKLSSGNGIFKDNEGPYGALTIIKRLWCGGSDSYLCKKLGIDENQFIRVIRYDSVQDVAKKNQKSSPYVAVIAMDGDEMGKWGAGEKTPAFLSLLEGQAKDYFKKLLDQLKNVDIRRPLSPGYHLQFSEALANFANLIAGKVVEKFDGQLIYAGGDDVLAMLPADRAIECARALRSLFRGEENFGVFAEYATPSPGFINIGAGKTLMVPGPNADVSCGIAIAHQNHPLQDIVDEARNAESRAKNKYGRHAVAVSVLKRGGETIHWGAKWDSAAWPLYEKYLKLDAAEILSGKFPSALAQLLMSYRVERKIESVELETMRQVILSEFLHVVEQQGNKSLLDPMRQLAEPYLNELLAGFEFDKEKNKKPKLEDFAKLFLTATFIFRDRSEY